MLTFVGLGLSDKKDISVKGFEAVKDSEYVYLENYTAILNLKNIVKDLEEFYGKKIILADRELVESKAEEVLEKAQKSKVCFLVVGDIFSATTHTDLFLRAIEKGIECEFIHNASIMNAVSITGLQLYKFGKTTSLVYPEKNYFPETAYDVIKSNRENKLHTLVLLDIKVDKSKYMTVNEAIKILEEIEEKRGEKNKEIKNVEDKKKLITKKLVMIGCARLGSKDFIVKVGNKEDLKKFDFRKPMHCLIIPGELHFKEEEMLEYWKGRF